MRVLVTGGCGFIGSHIVEHHLKLGDQVHIVDDLSTGTLANIANFKDNESCKFEQADLSIWPNIEDAVKSADRIYHFAASVGIFKVISDPLNVITSNISACERLFKAIADCKSKPLVIIASSSSVYGNSNKNPLSEDDDLIIKKPPHPLATYAISKVADEAIGLAYHRSCHIPVIFARLFNTIGPRQTGRYGMVVPRFVQQACRNEPFSIFGDGTQTRSFCDVRDVVAALDLLAKQAKAIGEIVNVGNDSEISINDLAILVKKCTMSDNQVKYIPYNEAYGTEFTDITQRRPDLSKLVKLTSFKHKWTLEHTIRDLISNFKKVTA